MSVFCNTNCVANGKTRMIAARMATERPRWSETPVTAQVRLEKFLQHKLRQMYSRPIVGHDLLQKDVAHKHARAIDDALGVLHEHGGEVRQTEDQPRQKECGAEVQPDNKSDRNRPACDKTLPCKGSPTATMIRCNRTPSTTFSNARIGSSCAMPTPQSHQTKYARLSAW